MISTLFKITSATQNTRSHNTLRFNGSLPISIEVLETLGFHRYKLRLGVREFTTKSHKPLENRKRYWGRFGENKDGVITISDLIEKPSFLQQDTNFLDTQLEHILAQFASSDDLLTDFKDSILANLAKDTTTKETFALLSHSLLALGKGVIHLPIKHQEKGYLLQLKFSKDSMEFYIASENLGPMRGNMMQKDDTIFATIELAFEQSLFFLKDEVQNTTLIINKNITPIYNENRVMVDLKG